MDNNDNEDYSNHLDNLPGQATRPGGSKINRPQPPPRPPTMKNNSKNNKNNKKTKIKLKLGNSITKDGGVIQKSTVSGFGSSKVVTEKVSNTKNKNMASNTATTQDVQQDQERELDAHFEQIASMYAMEIQQKLYVKLKCSNCVTIIVVTIVKIIFIS